MQSSAQPGERGLIVKKDSTGPAGNTYAIIVGISKYKVVRPLQYAHKDAQAFEAFLLSDAGGKIPPANVETFLNENATRSNVGDAISVVCRKAKPGDRVYFFFAGHGDMEDLTQIENGLLLLYNSPNGNYFGMNDDVLEIINLKRYLSSLSEHGVEMIFIVDACHSGNLKGGVEGVAQTASALANSWGKEYKILSCQPNQLSLESAEWGGGRGLFSLEMEEGMKGLADKNNDGKISFAELQRYITDNVSTFSEDKQIPLVSGDLSKSFVKVDPPTLALLKKQKAANYPILAVANTKGNEEKYVDSLDPAGKKIYHSFKKNLDDKKLIWPTDTNAQRDYKVFIKKYPGNTLIATMRRTLAASLNERFNTIVAPLLKGETSYSSRDACKYAAAELDSCLQLLGEQHYMYTNLKARKLYMDAMALTWAFSQSEYNISIKPVIENALRLLEESEALEPNAAYTMQQSGILYCDIFEYEKAYPKFQKYLDLRPNDFYSKYSLATIYNRLGKFEKAEDLFLQLIREYPDNVDLYTGLSDAYMNDNKKNEGLKWAKKIVDVLHDKFTGYFAMGVCYSYSNQVDSAAYYYKLSAKQTKDCPACYNNIGHIYFLNNKTDSAIKYFQLVLKKDSTFPNTNFNMATIDAAQGNNYAAISKFITALINFTPFDDCFNTNLQLYFRKNYHITDAKLYEAFKKKAFAFNSQYFSYLSILYCYLRDETLKDKTDKIEYIFSQMLTFKQHDPLTWFHYACYKALNNDNKAALEAIEKALKLGFGNYFMISSDADLDMLRGTAEFQKLLKEYFPVESKI
ncbi:MAG: caspase family protein [Chitinophagaceae bacterium]|nr:caspase family protein [Chitinophagaceae bacterium]